VHGARLRGRQRRPALDEPFGAGLPAGWTVVANTPLGQWRFDDPGRRGNIAGGGGGFASMDGAPGGKPPTSRAHNL
jgi:hypothetical protein